VTVILGEGTGAAEDARVSPWAQVPWRTIIASVLVVGVMYGAVLMIVATRRILVWVLIAGFVAIVLAPTVARVQAHVGGHRAVATALVMFLSAFLVIGMMTLFVLPIRSQIVQVATDLPGTVEEAANGRGPIGHIVTRLNLDETVRDHEDELKHWAQDVTNARVSIARGLLEGLIAFFTIFVTAFLLLTQSSAIGKTLLPLIPRRRRPAAQRVSVDAAAAMSGYMIGNFLISVVAGVTAFLCLLLLGVPNPAVFALWVAFADLIPLVGATLGAAVAVLAAFLQAPTSGIIALVFFIVYQQFENSVLQTTVMSRTVKVNPLVVLLSVLLGVELFGFAGALLAIPTAGSVQVAIREIWQETRRDRLVLPETDLTAAAE
jgi:predicted PurR-regulated permease PerM